MFLVQARSPRNVVTYVHRPNQEAEEHKSHPYVPQPLRGSPRNIILQCSDFLGRAFDPFYPTNFLVQSLGLQRPPPLLSIRCTRPATPRPAPVVPCSPRPVPRTSRPDPAQAAHRSPRHRPPRAPAAPAFSSRCSSRRSRRRLFRDAATRRRGKVGRWGWLLLSNFAVGLFMIVDFILTASCHL
jgi:hypothetical protein